MLKLARRTVTMSIALLVLAIAWAQENGAEAAEEVDWSNLPQYFERPETLAILVAAIVAVLRKQLGGLFEGRRDIVGFGVSLATGAVLGGASTVIGWSDLPFTQGLGLGIAAGFLASGGWDFAKGLLQSAVGSKS